MRKSPRGRLPREIFLSHASADRRMAQRLAEMLRKHGVPVWYSQTNLLGAQQWHDEIGVALARCDWFLLLLSPSATRSRWVRHELFYALRSERYDKRIIPLRYRKCNIEKLSWTLDGFQAVNFSGKFATGSRSLLRTWGIGYNPKA